MSFEVKRIGASHQSTMSLQKPKKSFSRFLPKVFLPKFQAKKKWHWLFALPALLISGYLVFSVAMALYDYNSTLNFTSRLFNPLLAGLQKDENGYINILLVGTGGVGHDGANLTDTQIVVSIDPATNSVSMLSIPRDLWVGTKKYGSGRINEIYRNANNALVHGYGLSQNAANEQAMGIFISEVERIVNIKIPYYMHVDFQGFIQVVDELGGIDIVADKPILDHTYPDFNWGYQTFKLAAGPHHLDGDTALKFARSRHNSSDFDRAARQQKVIQAVKEKALSLGILSSPRKLSDLYSVISGHFKTNFNNSELVALAFLGKGIDKSSIYSAVLSNDPTLPGGFLMTPPRANYGGASVVTPADGVNKYKSIQLFTELFFKHRKINAYSFEILNASGKPAFSYFTESRLAPYGFKIAYTNTAKKDQLQEKSELRMYVSSPEIQKAVPLLKKIIPVFELVDKTNYYKETDVAGTLILGKDFTLKQ